MPERASVPTKMLLFYNNPSVSLARATSLYTKEAFLLAIGYLVRCEHIMRTVEDAVPTLFDTH